MSYHLQLRRVYAEWGIPRAELVLRPSATVVPPRVMRVLERHRDHMQHFFEPQHMFDAWLARLLDGQELLDHAAHLERMLHQAIEQLRTRAQAYDPTLARSGCLDRARHCRSAGNARSQDSTGDPAPQSPDGRALP